ncbi:hypothetical protein [Kitasatospora aureofaciens]|uniref:hypothetical protein n=1 Tax=Kitasatospora aureofaciens TaxID=1894 RepID=UPI001C46AB67|nr:hypothetical protein [Kitasatospora aureofaciens]MBV6698587.1 hypothetical protein [Kitasatospora aureofaciens]
MYLVHAALRPLSPGLQLPLGARDLLLAAVRPDDRIEHLVVHSDATPGPALGVYLLADSLAEAEARTAAFCGRVLAAVPQLAGWRTERAAVPLVAPFYERLLSASGAPGRNGPGPLPST